MNTKLVPANAALALAILAALAASCANDTGADRLGGQGESEPVTLVLANPNHDRPDQLQLFADEVSDRTGGTVTIEFRDGWRPDEPDYESRTVEDVAAGKADLAWVGARVFDELGVNSFQALLAPMLVDSHDLQAAVFDAGIPAEMLTGLESLDVVGLGVLPGPLRKLVGIDHAFVSPDDFTGQVVGVQASVVADQTFAALGATTIDKRGGGANVDGVDAVEQQFESIAGNKYWQVADYVTSNVNLWPRPLVIFINDDVFDALSERAAAGPARRGSVGSARGDRSVTSRRQRRRRSHLQLGHDDGDGDRRRAHDAARRSRTRLRRASTRRHDRPLPRRNRGTEGRDGRTTRRRHLCRTRRVNRALDTQPELDRRVVSPRRGL